MYTEPRLGNALMYTRSQPQNAICFVTGDHYWSSYWFSNKQHYYESFCHFERQCRAKTKAQGRVWICYAWGRAVWGVDERQRSAPHDAAFANSALSARGQPRVDISPSTAHSYHGAKPQKTSKKRLVFFFIFLWRPWPCPWLHLCLCLRFWLSSSLPFS